MEREIFEMRKKIEELSAEERRIDQEIADINGQIKEEFLDN